MDIEKTAAQERNRIAREKAEEAWEDCDGCTENDKYMWIKGFIAGFLSND